MKPAARCRAGAEPVVPSSTAMLTGLTGEACRTFSSMWAARSPSASKSEPTSDTHRDWSESTWRSVRTTGIFADWASLSTVSQPLLTTGEKEMMSTFCAM